MCSNFFWAFLLSIFSVKYLDNHKTQNDANFQYWYGNFAEVILISLIFLCFSMKTFVNSKKKTKKNVDNGDSEAVAQRCSVKKVFLEISQNSLWNTCARVSFLQALDWKACNFIKKRGVFFFKKKETPTHRCFSVKFVKFLVKPVLKNICERMLLFIRLWFSEINHSPCNNMKGTIDKN